MSRFHKPTMFAAAIVACVLALASCGGQQNTGAGAQAQSPATQAPAESTSQGASTGAKAVTIAVRSGDSGEYLVDGSGNTVYLYTKDEQGVSNCSGECITAWPAVIGQPKAAGSVDESKLGTIQRESGKTQVTYAGHPLYYFVKDTEPGQITGQGVKNVWYLISPDGTAVKQQSSDSGGGY